MRINSRRMVALAVSILLMLSLFACGGTTQQNQQTTGTSQAAETTEKVQEPVTLTYKTYHTNVQSADIEGFENKAVAQAIKEKTNITVKVLPTKDNATELVTDMAADNMPDIFTVWAFTGYLDQLDTVTKAAKEGMLADLTKSIETYGSNISNSIKPEGLNAFIKSSIVYNPDFEGKIYMLPTNYASVSPALDGTGFYIRGDIAKALNISTPNDKLNTPDDLYNLLKTIKDGKFKNTNGKEIYPLGLIGGDWDFLFDVIKRPYDFGGVVRIAPVNGKLQHYMQTEYAWKTVEWLRKLLKDRLLDPEALTQKYEIGAEKIAQGSYGVMPFSGYYSWPNNEDYLRTLNTTNPEMNSKPLGNLQNHQGSKKITVAGTGDYSIAMGVSSKANTDAAVRLIDFLSTKEGKAIVRFGAEGDTWSWNDKNLAQMKTEAYDELTKDKKTYRLKYGIDTLATLAASSSDAPDTNPFGGNGTDFYYQNNPQLTDYYAGTLQAQMPDRTIDRRLGIDFLMAGYENKDKISPMLTPTKINEILYQCALVKSEDEAKKILNNYVDTLMKNGLQEYLDYLQTEYDKDPEAYSTYITSNM